MSRKNAVEEGEERGCGFIARNIPEIVLRGESYEEVRERLAAYAEVREVEEKGRTHYRCLLSFEEKVSGERARQMVEEWLKANFPKARAAAFSHHNTEHVHVHVWMDARQTDGKKLHLSERDYRRIDETWNRIYCRELNRPERLHLDKKEETRAYKRALAEGKEKEPPKRAIRVYDETRVRGNDTKAFGGASGREAAEREALRFAETCSRAVREVDGLRVDLERVGSRDLDRDIDRTPE